MSRINITNTCCSCCRPIDGVSDTCTECLRDVCHKCLLNELCKTCHSKLLRCTYCGAKLIRRYMDDEIEFVLDTCQRGYHCCCRLCAMIDNSETPNECVSCDKIIRIEAREEVDDIFCDLCSDCRGFCLYCFCTRDTLTVPSRTCYVCNSIPSAIQKHLFLPIASIVMEYMGQQQPLEFMKKRIKINRGRRLCRINSIVLTTNKEYP